MELFEELQWRGLVNDVTSPDLENEINNGELTFYIGTDPTADSLHIGHYSSLLMAKRLQKHGHHPSCSLAVRQDSLAIQRPQVNAAC